jgi:hemolysin activation/secretion protein
VLPPLPELPPTPDRPSSGVSVFIREVRIEGNTAFSDAELEPIVASYEGRAVAAEELLELRDRLTRRYVEAGYINSGAVIPDQDVVDGVLIVRIIEGRLDEVTVRGLAMLRPSFVEGRIRSSAEPALNVQALQTELQLLLADPTIDRLDARLSPGEERGESRLEVDVVEAPRFTGALRFDNDRSPSVGELQGEVEVVARSVLGFSDPLFARFAVTEGLLNPAVGYSVPLTSDDLRLRFYGEYNDAEVVEEPFDPLDIESESWTAEVGLRYPVIRTLDREVGLGVDFARRHSRTTILGDPFPVTRDGESDVTAFRFVGDGLDRGEDQVIALRSTFSLGIDALGATDDNEGFPDSGQFFAWLGQAQYARRFGDRGDQVILRSDLQLAADPLLPLEQIAIGGLESVRGYRRNEIVRDNGVVASIEGRIPLLELPIPGLTGPNDSPLLQFAPFADIGHGWDDGDRGDAEADAETLSSVGIGLIWTPSARIAARFYYGYALNEVSDPQDESLQDEGIHFELRVIPF